jgi:sucrose phosphorylase
MLMNADDLEGRMLEKLVYLYGSRVARPVFKRLLRLLESYRPKIPQKKFDFSERDAVLITYGDSFRERGEKPLSVLGAFLREYLQGTVTTVHVLPFFPFSSDDGFSVIDYRRVNPELGNWEDIHELGRDFTIMFDAVINHISAKSAEFAGFLRGEKRFRNFFIEVDPDFDISKVFRPRALPLLTPFETREGTRQLWTTFSTDQIDLNYANPEVLLFIIDILLFYVTHGASIIRLDAIAFLWKENGTECLHLPQTHTVIKLFRNVFDLIAPHVKIITETNVPHSDNISYFGSGDDEAHMVYNFALPPLTVHALLTADGSYLSEWASGLQMTNPRNYFYNFTASHDGIGLMPVRGILPPDEIDLLVGAAESHGGQLGLKDNPDSTQSVYELNISLFDLLSDPNSEEPLSLQVERFAASQAIAMSLAGVPALYYHSMVGSRNFHEGVEQTGIKRAINREKLQASSLRRELAAPGSRRSLVFETLSTLLKVRGKHRAFHPEGRQQILHLHPQVFAVERRSPDEREKLLALVNLSKRPVQVTPDFAGRTDTLSGRTREGPIDMAPYEILWLA